MTEPAIGVDIHFGPDSIKHKYHPASDKCHAYGVLKIDNGGSTYANLYFDTDPAHIDAMIAELVALKQEMDPPAAPCGKCHYPLDKPDHDEMCEQRAAFLAGPAPEQFVSGSPFCTARRGIPGQGGDLCELPLHHGGDHRAPGDDEGDEDVTWSDEAAAVTA